MRGKEKNSRSPGLGLRFRSSCSGPPLSQVLDKMSQWHCKDEICHLSSVISCVHFIWSTGRSCHGSTITLRGKPLEGTETSGNGTTICPLQGYLFGSAIELPETTTVVKKEHRTSLGELFQRTKIAEENYVTKSERGEKRTDKSAIHLMKKMLKKRMVHGSSRSSTTSTGGNVDSASSETKLHKETLANLPSV